MFVVVSVLVFVGFFGSVFVVLFCFVCFVLFVCLFVCLFVLVLFCFVLSCLFVCLFVCFCFSVFCFYVCSFVRLWLFFAEKNKQTNKQTNKQASKQASKQTNKQAAAAVLIGSLVTRFLSFGASDFFCLGPSSIWQTGSSTLGFCSTRPRLPKSGLEQDSLQAWTLNSISLSGKNNQE